MKKILIFFGIVFFLGCSTHNVSKPNPSVQTQKQDAQKAWKSLDKE